MTEEVSLHPATWRDFRSILVLERICFQEDAWPWMDVLAALTFPQTVRFKAVQNGRAVGFVIGDRRRKMGWVASIAVHPDTRRKGVGRELLIACEKALSSPRVRLVLRVSNWGAKALYDKSGYIEIDRWRRYYRDGEDGLVMEKVISTSGAEH